MKLIGSTTSPYVRRIRLLLENQKYEFETLKALSPEGAAALKNYGPVMRIPILISNGKTYFDSTIISEYLLEKKGIQLSIDEKLKLKLIDELCDSCICLFQQKLWEIDKDWKDERSKRMLERANLILDELDRFSKELSELQKDWLFCVLDWLNFRPFLDWTSERSNLTLFYNHAISLEKYSKTSPVL